MTSIDVAECAATIVFGTVTGNAQDCAERAARALARAGILSRVIDASDYPVTDLPRERVLLICASTYGDGDAPDNAVGLLGYLQDSACPQLSSLRYAVLAFGDRSYEYFCKCGADFDAALAGLGAGKLLERVECDVDYEELANGWITAVVDRLKDIHASLL